MTSVLFGGGLNYQRNNPLQAEIRSLRADIEDLRRLVEDVTYRLDKAGVAPLPDETTASPAPAPAPAPMAPPVYNPIPPAAQPTTGTGRRRG